LEKIKNTFATICILVTLTSLVTLVQSQDESLPYRLCTSPQTSPFNESISNNRWQESFDGSDIQYYCFYNDTVIYVQQDMILSGAIGPSTIARRTMSDSFIESIGFSEPLNAKVRDTKIAFDFYFPYCDGSDGCPTGICPVDVNLVTLPYSNPEVYNRQQVLVGDENANFTQEAGAAFFNDAIDDFTLEAIACGCDQWCHYEQLIGDSFENDYGSSFDNRNREIESVGFEVANIYLTNVKIIGTGETVDVW
jgi:hypothetical protein